MAEKVLNLIPSDVDRSIGHINPNVDCPHLEQLIVECMDSVAPVEREVQDRQGRWYWLRIRPYKSHENRIDGAVLALFDIDPLKRSEQRADTAEAFAEAMLAGAAQPTAVLGPDLHVRQSNPAFASLFGRSPDELQGRVLTELGGAAWSLDGWTADGSPMEGTRLPPLTVPPDPSGRWTQPLRVTGRVLHAPEDREAAVVLLSIGVGKDRE
jgi:two-component system CheB/CheR fusion protein